MKIRFVMIVIVVVALAIGHGLFLTTMGSKASTATVVLRIYGRLLDVEMSESQVDRYLRNESKHVVSDEILRAALTRPKLKNTQWYRDQPNQDVARARLREAIRAKPIQGTNCIEITLMILPLIDAPVVLDGITSTYLNRKKISEDNNKKHSMERLILSKNVSRAKDDLRSMGKQVDQFIAENDLLPMRVIEATYIDTQQRCIDVKLNLMKLNAELRRIERADESDELESDRLVEDSGVLIVSSEAQIDQQDKVLQVLEVRLTELDENLRDQNRKERQFNRLKQDQVLAQAKYDSLEGLLRELRLEAERQDTIRVRRISRSFIKP